MNTNEHVVFVSSARLRCAHVDVFPSEDVLKLENNSK